MSKTDSLLTAYEFMKMSCTLKKVNRHCNATKDRKESTAEHSWSVALYCWLLADGIEKEFSQKVDKDKLIKMALLHDLVETIVGDVSQWHKKKQIDKKTNEDKAAETIKRQLSSNLGKEFIQLWQEFELGKSLESRIVRALDRFSAPLQRLVTGQGWFDVKATTKDLDEIQLPRLNFSETLLRLYKILKKEAVKKKQILPN